MTNETKTAAASNSECNDLLSVAVCGGKYTVVQDHKGYLRALRYGETWRDCVGDGLILALAQEVDELRSLIKLARDEYLELNSDGETDCVTPYDRHR